MQQVSKSEFVEMFSEEMKKGRKVALDITSPVELKKTGNPFVGCLVTKSVTLSGCAGGSYESMANAQLVREGKEPTFEAQPRAWGVHVNEYFIEHKGNYYLQLKVEPSTDEPIYRVDGEQIDVEKLAPFLPKKSDPKTQEDLTKKVIIRDVKLDNIKAIRFNHKEVAII